MIRTHAILGVLLFGALPAMADDMHVSPTIVEDGEASVYSDRLQGKPTASGELHDQNALTAASRILPLGATALVTNLETGMTVQVEITDRGPYTRGRVIDLSRKAAESIGIDGYGTAPVRVETSAEAQPTQDLEDQVAMLSAKRAAHAKSAGR